MLLLPGLAYAQAEAQPAPGGGGSNLLLVALLLVISAFLTSAETAFGALGTWKVRQLREQGRGPVQLYAAFEANPSRFLSTVHIANNLTKVAVTVLLTLSVMALTASWGWSHGASVGYAIALSTLLVLLIGEFTPKAVAVQHPEAVSRLLIGPVYLLSVVLYPLGRAFTALTTAILRLLRIETPRDPMMTEDELRLMLRSAEESGVIEASEEEMIKGVIDLEETVVREVMTPRVDVVAIPMDASLQELVTATTEEGYSRLPVYQDSIDDVRGVVYARDLIPYLGADADMDGMKVADLMRPPQYVPETTSVLDLMRTMRTSKNHLAVVVDEFGGTAGVVTLEDIIEEITGEIYDETDDDEAPDFEEQADGLERVKASVHLEEVEARFRVSFGEASEYDTLAGFLISELGRIPQEGESLEREGLRFTVTEADERRVSFVTVGRVDSEPEEERSSAELRQPGG